VATGCGCTPTDVSGARSNVFILLRLFPFIPLVLFLFLCLSNHESSCFLFLYIMSGLVTGNVTAVASTISHFQTRVPFHMCVCVCVFFLCVVIFCLKSKPVFFSLEPSGWTWMGARGRCYAILRRGSFTCACWMEDG